MAARVLNRVVFWVGRMTDRQGEESRFVLSSKLDASSKAGNVSPPPLVWRAAARADEGGRSVSSW